MKRSFKNLFMIIVILVTSIASGLNLAPAQALGSMDPLQGMPGLPIAPGQGSPLLQGYLNGVWGADSTHIFAVGYGNNGTGTPAKPVIYQTANGTNWTSDSPQLPSGFGWGTGRLESVWGVDSSNVFAVGTGGVNTLSLPLVSVWNGSNWIASSPSLPSSSWGTGQLNGVWGSGLSDIYAVGHGGGTGFIDMPLVFHWNGSEWSSQGLTLPGGYTHAYLEAVWGTGSANIYAAGRGQDAGNNDIPLLYKYNGTSWSPITLSLPSGWTRGQLDGIWGSSANDIYAVGTGNNSTMTAPLIYHWNGSTWSSSHPSLPTTDWSSGYLYGVWGDGAGEVYAVGYGHNAQPGIDKTTSLLYRKTSSGWAVSSPDSGMASGHFQGIWGYDTNNVYAVGYGYDAPIDAPLLSHAGSDTVAPGAVTDLSAESGLLTGTVDLTWIAPADDGPNPPDPNAGPVASYLVKYSETGNLTGCDDPTGTPASVSDLPVPVTPGTTQTMRVTNLTPFTTYYFSVCAKDDENNLSSAATASAAARGVGIGVFDDTDLRWTYSAGWAPITGATGPYNGTFHYTETTGTSASFTFQAPAMFVFYYAKNTNRGTFEIRVDGALLTTINPYATTKTWQNKYTSPVYSDTGSHTVMIKNISPTGKQVDVDAIEIVAPPPPAGMGIYDDTDPHWIYSSGWAPITGATGPYNGTFHYTETTNTSASFTFQAPAMFVFYYAKNTNRGTFEIRVDGALLTTINPYATTKTWQNKYTSPVYSDTGTHTVEIKNISPTGKQVDVDAIEITVPPTPAGMGIYDDTDPHWIYSSGWAPITGATGPYHGTFHYTETTGTSASFTFQAPAMFVFYYAKYTNRGTFEIRVDGALLTTINPYATTKTWQNKYASPVYSDTGTHTVEIKNVSPTGKQVDVDAIEITGPPTPAGMGIYDDTDPHWSYSSGWSAITGATGPYNGTFHYTETTGTSASFTFQAPAMFVFYYAKYTNRGTFEIRVDGALLTTINPYATTKTWQNKYASPLYTGTAAHTVEIRNISPTGKQVDVDAIEITVPPTPAGPGTYDDTDSRWQYNGSWSAITGATGPYNGTFHYTETTGTSASFTFQAPARFTFYYAKYTQRGVFEIWVDGSLLITIDPYSTTKTWQNTYTSPQYTGTAAHTVEIKNISPTGKQVDIDAIKIE